MAGSSTVSYQVHSQTHGYKSVGYLKTAREIAQRWANEERVSVGIYQVRYDGKKAKSWAVWPKKMNPSSLRSLFNFKKIFVLCDGKKYGSYTRAKANKFAVAIARVTGKPARIVAEVTRSSNSSRMYTPPSGTGSVRKTKKRTKKQAGSRHADLLNEFMHRGRSGVKQKRKFKAPTKRKRNPKPQFVLEWGTYGKTAFFDTLAQAKKYKSQMWSRGILHGRRVKIKKLEMGKAAKTVFDKQY